MKDILVYSRPAIENAKAQDVPHVIVSINCPGEEPASIKTNELTLGRVNLFFWDLDRHVDGSTQESCPLMTERDAEAIATLVHDNLVRLERIVVHCTAGKSRSAAVAAACHLVLNGSDKQIFADGRYFPNMLVYRLTSAALYAKMSEPW